MDSVASDGLDRQQWNQHGVKCGACSFSITLNEYAAGSPEDLQAQELVQAKRKTHATVNRGHRVRSFVNFRNVDCGTDYYAPDSLRLEALADEIEVLRTRIQELGK